MPRIIKHIVGPFEGGMQFCIICGKVICDYRNACWPSGQEPPQGFSEGVIYMEGVNPTSFYTELAPGDTAENCEP